MITIFKNTIGKQALCLGLSPQLSKKQVLDFIKQYDALKKWLKKVALVLRKALAAFVCRWFGFVS